MSEVYRIAIVGSGPSGLSAAAHAAAKGVSHVLRDDPTDNVGNYSKQDPLSPQLTTALDGFVDK